jgi:monoamine oxidase
LGPYGCGKDLSQVSTVDFARSAERDSDAFCRQGFGALIAALAVGIPVKLATPALGIDMRRGVVVETPKGTIAARAVIVTVSTNVIASGAVEFTPDLGERQRDAFAKLSLGSYDHIALEFADNALGLESDDLVFEKSTDAHTAAILANVSGTSLCLVEVAGQFGSKLAAQGEAAMVDFAADWLAGLYGAEIKKSIKRSQATRWNSDPFSLGAFSAAAPGGQSARRVLMEPIREAIWFAGEAAHETLWGTVGGAWESGERTADAVLRHLAGQREPLPAHAQAPVRHKTRRRPEAGDTPVFDGVPRIFRE